MAKITAKQHNDIVDYFTTHLASHATVLGNMPFKSALGYMANLEFGKDKTSLNNSKLKLQPEEIVNIVGHVLNKFKYGQLPTSI